MPWQQLELTLFENQYALISEYLEGAGALAITLLDAKDTPLFEPEPGTTPLWHEIKLVALFPEDFSLQSVIDELHRQQISSYSITQLADQVWERQCMDQFQPQCFGEKLWICPSWHEVNAKNACIVHLDPGLAFGTGSHPTTKLCLEWLATHDLQGLSIIDYGCGSGILGIAAMKLGADKVYAVDIDPQALQATAENAIRNQLPMERIIITHPEQLQAEPVAIIIANILVNPLLKLVSHFNDLLLPHGKVVLSGILAYQAAELCEVYSPHFKLEDEAIDGEWARLCLVKQSA